MSLDSLLQIADSAASAGSAVVRSAFRVTRNDVHAKAAGDWVSEADLASEDAIRAVLERATPDIPVLGEERGGTRAERGWLVDPLDGTTNFLHEFPAVGVSVALVDGGRPVVGAVHAPLLDERFLAAEGLGATRNGVRLTVSARPPARAIVATGLPFRGHKPRLTQYLPVFERILRATEDVRRVGAASLDLAWTAAGVWDGYFELNLGPWDLAAGAVLVREAGGIVTDWSGDPTAWLASGDVVAGPPAVHAELIAKML